MLVSIRDAHRDDLDVIMQFIKELAEYEKLEGDAVGSRELFDESLFGSTTPAAKVVIASMDSKDVGFALYYDNFSTCTGRRGMHLEDLFVRETHRKCGIGRKLLAHLAKVAVQRGYLRFEWSALKWNSNAAQFYHNLGARSLIEWDSFRLEGDALLALANT